MVSLLLNNINIFIFIDIFLLLFFIILLCKDVFFVGLEEPDVRIKRIVLNSCGTILSGISLLCIMIGI